MKTTKLISIAVLCAVAASCSSPSKQMAKVETLGIESSPAVLEAIAGNVDVEISFTYPEKYFNPKAIVEIVPVIVYEGGEAASDTIKFQGQKVKRNYPVVLAEGGTQKAKAHFAFVPAMAQSYLEIRSTAVFGKDGKKRVALPTVKVADGVNYTYTLAERPLNVSFRADEYQDTLHLHVDTKVQFDQSSAIIQPTAENRAAVHAYDKDLKKLAKNERIILRGSHILSYASPEGGVDFNQVLTDHRAVSARDKWVPMTRGVKIAKPEVQSLGQDWEGFKEAVEASDLIDKHLIIRVLSMYQDPEQREQEIRNIVSVYCELKKDVLPALRRAIYVVDYDFVNYTADELKQMKADGTVLDEGQLLHLAAVENDLKKKAEYFREAYQNYQSKDAAYGLAVVSLYNRDYTGAQRYLASLEETADVLNVKGAIEYARGNEQEALRLFRSSANEDATLNIGSVQILAGQYTDAVRTLKGSNEFNEALANILVGNLDAAQKALKCSCPRSSYLRAIIAARKGQAEEVAAQLEKASVKADLKARAEKDIEFVNFR